MKRSIPLYKIFNSPAIEQRAVEVIRSGAIAAGIYSEKFNAAFSALIRQPYVVTTNDMSNALQIALRLAGVRPGDAVLTTPFACMSTNAPIAMAGAVPAWVDVDPATATMDLESLRRTITPRCKALVLYHVAGYPGPVEEISQICEEYGIALIEDCDNALLATVNGRPVGDWGRFAIYSFYPNRQINATEGGALSCKTLADAERASRLRRYGIEMQSFRTSDGEINPECDIGEIGYAATLNNLCSAIAYEQLVSVSDRVEATRGNARALERMIETIPGIESIRPLFGSCPSYWGYLIRSPERDSLMQHLHDHGVRASKLHYLNTRYTGFGVVDPKLKGSSELMDTILALPCGWWLSKEDVNYLKSSLESFSTTR